jgi:hypothetical protein
MSTHRIRLAGPWEWQPVTGSGEVATAVELQKCLLPFPPESSAATPAVSAGAGILLLRRFHCPTGITANTTVAVILEIENCDPMVRLNDLIVTGVSNSALNERADRSIPNQWRFEVSGLLKSFNELQVRLAPLCSDSRFGLNTAALEIRES